MRPKVAMDEVNDKYTCSLCYELFLYPVTLPCKHIFCKLCFDKHIESNGFTCPICRRRLSNWLRKLNSNKSNIVDNKLWRAIQRQYPKEVRERKKESLNGNLMPVLIHNNRYQKDKIFNCHLIEDIAEDLSEEWRGWPVADSTCRDVTYRTISQIGYFHQNTNEQRTSLPNHNFAKPGEIREEYNEQLRSFQLENRLKEEENLRLSEALIKLIEEDERKEIEQLEKEKADQLRIDEELVKRLIDKDSTVQGSNHSTIETITETDVTNSSPYRGSDDRMEDTVGDNPVFLGPCSKTINLNSTLVSSSSSSSNAMFVCSTPEKPEEDPGTCRHASASPILLDTPSCSKVDIFAKYWNEKSNQPSSSGINLQKTPKVTSVAAQATSISNKELSHFAPVAAGPSTSKIDSGVKTVTMSRSSSGADSIGQELCHFKPIRTSPTTPPKDGKSSWLPQVVLAQKSVNGQELTEVRKSLSSEVMSVLSSNPNLDLSVEDLEESLALENQLEADRMLALTIQREWTTEDNKKRRRSNPMVVKTDYNLRKKGKGNLRKKVLMDRTQTKLDNMLIK